MTLQGADRQTFIHLLLQNLGAPETDENIQGLNAWIDAEGTNAQNNPLATTQPWPGATNFNSVPVRNYPTLWDGVQATTTTLLNGRYNTIVDDFRAGSGNQIGSGDAGQELNVWGTGAALFNRVLGTIQSGGGSGSSSSQGSGSGVYQGGAQTKTVGTGSDCLISLPSIGPLGGGCLLTKSQAAAIVGAAVTVGGGFTMLVGVTLIAATSGLGKTITNVVPGGQLVSQVAGGSQLRRASSGTRSSGTPRQRREPLSRRNQSPESARNTADSALRDQVNYESAETQRRTEQAGARKTIKIGKKYYPDTGEKSFAEAN